MGDQPVNENLLQRIEELEREVFRLSAIEEIRRLHHIYGYYTDENMGAEIVDLFTEDGELSLLGGIYRGKESLRRFYVEGVKLVYGVEEANRFPDHLMVDHTVLQDVITVAPDGQTAEGRFRALQQIARHPDRHAFSGAVWENDYVHVDGVWKIRRVRFCLSWLWPYPLDAPPFPEPPPGMHEHHFPTHPLGSDEDDPSTLLPPFPMANAYFPFHFTNPVTGAPTPVPDPTD